MTAASAGQIPESLSIGDVSKICQIPVHTVRYWECEFRSYLNPLRTLGRQRRFSDDDIRKIMRIKDLLWTQRFSIKAAKRILGAGMPARLLRPYPNQTDGGRLLMRMVQISGGNLSVAEPMAA